MKQRFANWLAYGGGHAAAQWLDLLAALGKQVTLAASPFALAILAVKAVR